MKKIFIRYIVYIAAIVTVLSLLCSCSMKSAKDLADNESYYYQPSAADSIKAPESIDQNMLTPADQVKSSEKIIEYVTMQVQTTSFDDFTDEVQSKVAELGGYIERSNIEGNSYNYINSNRSARFVLRIPTGNKNEMTEYIGKSCTVVSKEVNTENVTLEYVDIESRISALNAEKEALESLLAKADSTSDIIAVQSALTDVIYQIESYSSRLRTFDNLVDYMTLTLNVFEVQRVSVTEKQGVFERIGTNLGENFEDIGNGLLEFFVWLISSIPYLLLIAVIVFIIWLIIWLIVRSAKKRRARRNAAYANMNAAAVQQSSVYPEQNANNYDSDGTGK